MNAGPLFQVSTFGGKRAGPHLLITAGVHGDEYLPMLAVMRLVDWLRSHPQVADALSGRLTMVPIVNRSAFQLGARCGEDGLDLARICPGAASGTVSERAAHSLARLIRASDYYIDLHTGGTQLCVQPLAGYVLHNDQEILRRQRELARAFQLPLVWGTAADLPGRSLSVARDAGVPAIYVEYLGAHRELSEACGGWRKLSNRHPLIAGCLNALRHLGLLNEPEGNEISPTIIEDWRSGSGHMQLCLPAPTSGLLTNKAELGGWISPGDVIAEIHSEDDGEMHTVSSEQEGVLVVLRDYPRIRRGDSVAVIAESFESS